VSIREEDVNLEEIIKSLKSDSQNDFINKEFGEDEGDMK